MATWSAMAMAMAMATMVLAAGLTAPATAARQAENDAGVENASSDATTAPATTDAARETDPETETETNPETVPGEGAPTTLQPLSQLLGGPVGATAAHPDKVLYIMQLLQNRRSERVKFTPIGRSHEGRQLGYLTISSPENIKRLDAVQAEHQAASTGQRGFDEGRLDALPGVAWIGASIHGDELSGTDAAIALAYTLATSTTPEIEAMLDELVIHIDPLQNPDGRARYLAQIKSLRGQTPNPDPAALHHAGGWSSGRGNHYLFDLNRDWVPMTQPETQRRVKAYLDWLPHLVIDAHEMGTLDTFLFDPPREPINPALAADIKQRRTDFGARQAAAFDARGWAFYTQEWYEEWYPGYTNAWASLGGSIGLLFEQAAYNESSVTLPDGRIEHYADAVERQRVGMEACLQALLDDHVAIIRERFSEARAALDPGSAQPRGVLIVRPTVDPTRIDAFAALLKAQGIEVGQADDTFVATNARDTGGDVLPRLPSPAGTLVIRSTQPRRRMLHALCDFDPRMTDDFLLEERTRIGRGDGSMLYDVTAWNLPMAHGMDAWWAESIDAVATRPWAPTATPAHRVEPAPAGGWVVDGHARELSAFLATVTAAGHAVRVATRPFELDGRMHPAGSLLFRRAEQPKNFYRWLADATKGRHLDVINANGGLTGNGVDLGGQRFMLVRHPRVAMVSQWPISTTGFGGLWHALDFQVGLPVSPITATGLGGIDLRRYDVIVLPPAGRLAAAIDPSAQSRLEAWVRDGGTLIAVGSSVDWAIDAGLSSLVRRRDVLPSLEAWQASIEQERADRTPTVDLDAVWGGRPADEQAAAEARAEAEAAARETSEARDRRVDAVTERLLEERPTVGSVPPRPRRPERRGDGGGGSPRDRSLLVVGEALLAGQTESARKAPLGDASRLPSDPEARARADANMARFSPSGVFARAEIDPEHWLTFGMENRPLPVLVAGSTVHLSRSPTESPVRLGAAEGLRLSGLLWPEARERLHRSTWAGVDRVGRGQVICFPHDPVFRGSTESTRRLFENAVLLGPSLGVDVPNP
ncbi:MAG: M14 family metallopeptidase [Phycisphaerales bacterium]